MAEICGSAISDGTWEAQGVGVRAQLPVGCTLGGGSYASCRIRRRAVLVLDHGDVFGDIQRREKSSSRTIQFCGSRIVRVNAFLWRRTAFSTFLRAARVARTALGVPRSSRRKISATRGRVVGEAACPAEEEAAPA